MDRNEAHQLLVEQMQHYMKQPYAELEKLIGGEHVSRIYGASGRDYYFELYVSRACDRAASLEIEGFISEIHGACVMSALEHFAYSVDQNGQPHGVPAELSG